MTSRLKDWYSIPLGTGIGASFRGTRHGPERTSVVDVNLLASLACHGLLQEGKVPHWELLQCHELPSRYSAISQPTNTSIEVGH
jgi:hypothetical protein